MSTYYRAGEEAGVKDHEEAGISVLRVNHRAVMGFQS
jgi:hypothetical protein